MNLIILFIALKITICNPSAATIPAHYLWAIGLLLSDVHLSELELTIINDTRHYVISLQISIILLSGWNVVCSSYPNMEIKLYLNIFV